MQMLFAADCAAALMCMQLRDRHPLFHSIASPHPLAALACSQAQDMTVCLPLLLQHQLCFRFTLTDRSSADTLLRRCAVLRCAVVRCGALQGAGVGPRRPLPRGQPRRRGDAGAGEGLPAHGRGGQRDVAMSAWLFRMHVMKCNGGTILHDRV